MVLPTDNQSESTGSATTDLFAKYADIAPFIIDFYNHNQDNPLAKILAWLAGVFFDEGQATFPPVDPALESSLVQKAERKIDPLAAAKAYQDALMHTGGTPPDTITVRYQNGENVVLTKQTYIDDGETGFKGAVFKDQNGHSIVLYGGMDIMNGGRPDWNDFEAIAQARMMKNSVNQQTGPAQHLYEEALRSSSSVEIIGYSMGSMLANDIAARLDAKVTNFADIGLPNLKDQDGKPMYTPENITNVRENVVSLRAGNDSYFAKAGAVHAQEVIRLPSVPGSEIVAALGQNGLSLPSAFNAHSTMTSHHPMAYILASDKLAPPVDTSGGTTVAANTPPPLVTTRPAS